MGRNMRSAPRLDVLALGALAAATLLGCATPAPGPADPAAVAQEYLDAGRLQMAVREVELAVRTHPRDTALRMRAARIHRVAENAERAIGHLEVALQLNPTDAEISIQLGQLEQQRENLADAYVAYRRAMELAPDDIRAATGLALTAEAMGFQTEAEQAYADWARIEREQGIAP